MVWHTLVTILVISVVQYSSCLYNHTKQCFVNNNKMVMWNVTFTDSKHPNIQSSDIQMQMKWKYEGGWQNLTRCLRNTFSIQCAIIDDPGKIKFLLHVMNVTSLENLMSQVEEQEVHYSNGYKCRPNHNYNNDFVQNFTISNVTSNSMNISWSFYKWDLDQSILDWFQFYVCTGDNCTYTDHKGHTDVHEDVDFTTSHFYSRIVSGLQGCTSYKIQVIGSYDAVLPNPDHIVQTTIQTKCNGDGSKLPVVTTIIMSAVSFFVLLAVICLILYLVKRRKRRRKSTEVRFDNVVKINGK